MQQWTNFCTNFSPKSGGGGRVPPVEKSGGGRRPPASPPHYIAELSAVSLVSTVFPLYTGREARREPAETAVTAGAVAATEQVADGARPRCAAVGQHQTQPDRVGRRAATVGARRGRAAAAAPDRRRRRQTLADIRRQGRRGRIHTGARQASPFPAPCSSHFAQLCHFIFLRRFITLSTHKFLTRPFLV